MVDVVPLEGRNAIALRDLKLQLPSGVPLLASDNIAIEAGDQVLVTGPSGAGKSTLFRAVAGIWSFGAGRIEVPKESQCCCPSAPISRLERSPPHWPTQPTPAPSMRSV
jgi:putative ATP-binding cassette transporter